MRVKFWQKAYLLTLALFLTALMGSVAALAALSQQRSFEAECGKLLAQQHAVAQSFALDAVAVQARRPEALPQLARNYAARQRGAMLLRVTQGRETWVDELPAPERPLPDAPPAGQRVHTVRLADGRHVLYVLARMPAPPEDVTLICAFDIEPFFAQWTQTKRLFFAAGALASLALAAALYFVLRSLSRPMEQLAAVAGRLAQGDYSVRSARQSRDEVGQLARSLDEMACQVQRNVAQLEQAAQDKQRLVDNVAHELRTPLTAIGGYAEYLQRAQLGPEETYEVTQYIIEETKRLSAMSERLLQMASLRGEQAVCDPVETTALLRAVLRTMGPKAQARGVRLEMAPVKLQTVYGEASLLESLLVNLADNAVKACRAGDVVELGADDTPAGARLWVRDTGCGMDAETLAHLGAPFYRPDKARSREQGGAGLGLCLCRAIAAAHGARLEFASQPGKGTVATLRFTAS